MAKLLRQNDKTIIFQTDDDDSSDFIFKQDDVDAANMVIERVPKKKPKQKTLSLFDTLFSVAEKGETDDK